MLKVLTLIFVSLASQITLAEECNLFEPIKLNGSLIDQTRPIVLTKVRTLGSVSLSTPNGDFNNRAKDHTYLKLTMTPIPQVNQATFPLFHARIDGYRSHNGGETYYLAGSLEPQYDPQGSMQAERYAKTEMIYKDDSLKLTSFWEGSIFFPENDEAKFHIHLETKSFMAETWITSIKITYPTWNWYNDIRSPYNFKENVTTCVIDADVENQ